MRRNNYYMNEEGLTLIEVLGSIVILLIIVISILTFFTHSARTTHLSEGVSGGLYFAQKKVEEIYHKSNHYDYDQLIGKLISESDQHQSVDYTEVFLLTNDDYQMTILIKPAETDASEVIKDLYTLTVSVYDHTDEKKAKLETKFFFDEADADD